MAWEEENIEGAEFEEVAGKKSPMKMIIIIVVALVVLGGGGFFAWNMFMKEDPAATEETGTPAETPAEQPAKPAAAPVANQGPAPETGFKVDLKEFTVNLADEEETRYMRAKIVLEVSTQELHDALTDEADAHLYMVKSRDLILDVLRSKTAADMSDPGNVRELRKEISTRMNTIFREGQVMEVYITDLVVQ
jgi:flagellar FliL protein